VVGEAAIDGLAGEEALLGGGGVGEIGAGLRRGCGRAEVEGLDHAAVVERGKGRIEKDGCGGRGLLEQEAVGEGFGGATAEGEDDVVAAERGGKCLRFKLTEAGFAVRGEDGWDGHVGAGLDVSVEVEEVPAEAVGEQAADGGLAGAHEAGEDEAAKVGRRGGGRDGHLVGLGLVFARVGGLDVHIRLLRI